jgi:hypothetical protein
LKNQALLLEEELAAIQKRVEELGKKENNAWAMQRKEGT